MDRDTSLNHSQTMASINTEEPLSSVSENSFVILGQGSLPPSINGEYSNEPSSSAGFEKNDNNNAPILEKSFNGELFQSTASESSFSETSAQERLSQLLKENYHLRETLTQNNLAIKSQLDTFVMWQQEVLKTHETHKQKFLETKELILKLKAENADLKKELLGNMKYLGSLNGVLSPNEETVGPGTYIDDMKKEIGVYKQKCECLVVANENLKAENYKLKEELKIAESNILKLSKEIEDFARENKFLKEQKEEQLMSSPETFSYISLPNSEARAQITNLSKQLEEEKIKVSKLKEEIQKLKSDNPVLVESKASTTEELGQCINKLDNMNISFDLQNQRLSSIMSWVSLAETNLNTLKDNKVDEGSDCLMMSEITQLKNHLHQEVNSFKQKQESLQEIHSQFQKLLEDYKELQQKVKLLESNGQNIQNYKDEIKILNDEIKSKNENLELKNRECDMLKESVKKLNLECEEVAILRVQVQLYQTDFNDERAAREKLVGEKEAMAEQIRALQTRIEELESHKSKSSENPQTESPSKEKKSRFVCPKCMFSFSDLKRCEEHVEECLNIHFYP